MTTMEMPRPIAAHRKLAGLEGSWSGTDRMHPSPWDPTGGQASSRIESRVALDGFAVVQDYEQTRNGVVSFRGHAIFTYDAAKSTYLMYWFDNMGFPPAAPSPGEWKDDAFVFVERNPMGNSRYTYRVPAPGKLELKIETSLDGTAWRPFLEGQYATSG
jgi:hypothetical protein